MRPVASVLPPAESEALRERLIGELDGLTSAEQLTEWAYRTLTIKNTLTGDDALLVEKAFRAELEEAGRSKALTNDPSPTLAARPALDRTASPESPADGAAEKSKMAADDLKASGMLINADTRLDGPTNGSVLASREPRRYRDKAHLRFVSSQACLVCGRQPSDPHHLRFAQPRALGRKVSDEYTVPLCRTHHRDLHRRGNEAEWWTTFGIDPHLVARALWAQTRPVSAITEPVNPVSSIPPTGSRNRKTNPILTADPE